MTLLIKWAATLIRQLIMSIVIKKTSGECVHTHYNVLKKLGIEIPVFGKHGANSFLKQFEISVSEFEDLPNFSGFKIREVDGGFVSDSDADSVEKVCRFLNIEIPTLDYVKRDGGWVRFASDIRSTSQSGDVIAKTDGMVYNKVFAYPGQEIKQERYILWREHDWSISYEERQNAPTIAVLDSTGSGGCESVPEGFTYDGKKLINIKTGLEWHWAV